MHDLQCYYAPQGTRDIPRCFTPILVSPSINAVHHNISPFSRMFMGLASIVNHVVVPYLSICSSVFFNHFQLPSPTFS
jgi:hypothetical protein